MDLSYIGTIKKRPVKFSRISMSYAVPIDPNEFHTFTILFIYFFRKCVNFLFFYVWSPTEQKGNCLRASWLLCTQPYTYFRIVYAYTYGNIASRIFINGSLFFLFLSSVLSVCLIVNLVFILLGPSSILNSSSKEEMRYKCIHSFPPLCAIDCAKKKEEFAKFT